MQNNTLIAVDSDLSIQPFSYLPIELFDLGHTKYVFDAKNVVFLEVEDPIYSILGVLRQEHLDADMLALRFSERFTREQIEIALEHVEKLQNKGILVSYHFERRPPRSAEDIECTITTKLGALTLFMTTKCNLACSYCIFGGDYDKYGELNQESMSWETAKNAIDFLVSNSNDSESLRLDFFGGEPLLSFDLVQKSLEYLEGRCNRETIATVATNGTVLTDAMLDFFIKHQVHLQFSIDLDQHSHDCNRKFKNNGRPSYDIILTNLQRICDRDSDYFHNRIHIKTVVTPESSKSGGEEEIHPLVRELNRLSRLSPIMKEPHYDMALDGDYFDAVERLGDELVKIRGAATIEELLNNLNFRQKVLYYKTFDRMLGAQVMNCVLQGGLDQVPFAKGCNPGSEAAVAPNGDLSICQKSGSFIIGNVNGTGWDFNAIRRFDALHHRDWPRCNSCFVQRLCELCYEKVHATNWDASRHNYCTFNQNLYRLIFDRMLRVFDQNPALWPEVGRLCREARDRRSNKTEGHSAMEMAQTSTDRKP